MHLRKYIGHIFCFRLEWKLTRQIVKQKFGQTLIQILSRILKRHPYILFMWKQVFVYMFMKNFVLIDQTKFLQLKFTPFFILCFEKSIKNQAKQTRLFLVLWWSKIWHSFCSVNLKDMHEQDVNKNLYSIFERLYCE